MSKGSIARAFTWLILPVVICLFTEGRRVPPGKLRPLLTALVRLVSGRGGRNLDRAGPSRRASTEPIAAQREKGFLPCTPGRLVPGC